MSVLPFLMEVHFLLNGSCRHALNQLLREEDINDDHRHDGDHQSRCDHADILQLIAHEFPVVLNEA